MRTAWTRAQIDDFRQWHRERLVECGYPANLAAELAAARDQWLSSVRVRETNYLDKT